MSKELFISSSPHETKVAALEADLLVEVYYERDTDVGLVGGIYKGRVSRVLPGMQSAFVDIGLERDAFLYVSDFFLEDQEEYDKVFEEAEARATRIVADEAQAAELKPASSNAPQMIEGGTTGVAVASSDSGTPPATSGRVPSGTLTGGQTTGLNAAEEKPAAPVPPAPYGGDAPDHRRPEYRGRRRRRRGRGFGEHRFVHKPERPTPHTFEILPGESLAKYSHATPGGSFPSTATGSPGQLGTQEATLAGRPEAAISSPGAPLAEQVSGHEIQDVRVSEPESIVSGGPAQAMDKGTPTAPLESESTTRQVDELHPVAQTTGMTESVEGPVGSHQATTGEESTQSQEWESTVEPEEEETPSAELIAEPGLPADVGSVSSSGPPPEAILAEAQLRSDGGDSSATRGAATGLTLPEAQGEPRTVSGSTPVQPSERTYTLREPYQRPRYAPRRGPRGGRGRRAPRPGGRPERARPASGQTPQISQLLKEGQEILVQIAKEPLGSKGARITSHIALPGRYLVLMPTIDHIGVSRKIASEQERLRLRNIILENKASLSGGFIVRTAGEGRPEEEIKADLRFLSSLWSDIKARAERANAPALIHRDLDLVQRILRDTLSPDFKSVRVDNEAEYERVVEFISHCQPSLAGHVKLHTRETPLFEEFGIQAEIEKALKPKVWLKSGGYIVINQTEALVAIDVNTGKYVGKTNRLEDTILKTNIEAVNEIVRQIRLRDVGGIIVIDFIDMDERRNRIKVVQALEDALRHDRAPTKITSFHDFGLVAITRKRVKQSLERTLCEPCDYCSGAGWVKSATTVCYEILAEVRKMAGQIEGGVLNLRVNPDVARGLKSRDGMLILELESLTHKDVIIKSDPSVHRERFEIF